MNWIAKHWFLLALTSLISLAFFAADWIEPLLELKQVRMWVVATVLFLMALPLPLSKFASAIMRPQAALLAIGLNIGLAPLLAWPFLYLLGSELGGGLAIAVSTPCTLASAAVWTRRAGGNDVTALMVTVVTNLACVVVTPAWLLFLTANSEAQIDIAAQVQKLATLVVLPIIAAQTVRTIPTVGQWASDRKPWLSILAQIGLLYIVLLGSSASFIRWNSSNDLPLADWLILISAVVLIHLGLFAIGLWLSGLLSIDSENRRAVAIAGSQKTLMVGAEMGLSLNLSILPLVLYHVFQLFADTFLADWLRRRYQSDQPSDIKS